MKALDRKLVRDLWHLRGQAATIALVMACGIGAFVAQLSTYESLRGSRAAYYETARFAQIFAPVKRAPDPVAGRIAELPGVAEAEATVVADVLLDLPGVAEPVSGRMIGVEGAGGPRLNRLYLRQGRLPEPGRGDEALVSEAFAKARGLKPGDGFAALLNGKKEHFRIVGVVLSPEYIFSAKGGMLPDDRSFGVFWVGRERLAAAYDLDGAFNHAAVRLAPGASEPALIAALDRLLEPYGAFGAYGREDQISDKILSQEIEQQKTMAAVFPMVFLAVAAFLVNVVLARQVATQREQIASLKALGYADSMIAGHYLKLVLVIAGAGIVLGLAIGVVLGQAMTEMYARFFHFPLLAWRLDAWIPLSACAVSLAAAVAAALGTVRGVLRLAPAEAMRPPAPGRYRRMLLERLGLEHWLSAQARMVVRLLERRLARTLLTTFGIASAMAILIAGTFWRDALDYLVELQFHRLQREDAAVMFTDPVNASARNEIARMPGVLAAEASRSVAVRLRSGHHQYRTALLGLPQRPALRVLRDAAGREISLPAEGVVLSGWLANRLQLGPGDWVEVAVLEGRRPKRMLPVIGLSDDLVGLNAYMEIRALNRLMGEGDAVSAVSVIADAAQAEELYLRLKQMPKVSTVMVKATALQSFREISAQNVLFFTTIVTVFAVAIAVGVVYNSARISLAERAWELASLRVLGFTRHEVSGLLLGELAVMLGLAIPLGLWLGYLLSFLLVALMQTETQHIPLVIYPRTYAYAALAIVAAGVLSALIVRARVDRLDLVAVLKTRE
ncbi:MAG TPA: ABC transporter permease [Burkholderiales bacterium]|nr:ABC transporter permease [Burkholderiales bacterium]